MTGHHPTVATAEQIAELRRMLGGSDGEVARQLLKGGEWGLDDATCRRWILARKGNLHDAARDLTAHAAWRAAFVPKGRIHEDEITDDLAQNKSFLPGYCKDGRPLCIVVVNRHKMNDAESSKRCIAYALDCAVLMGQRGPLGAAWDGKMSGIFDLRGLKMSNCDFATLRNVFDLLQHHYPERLEQLWLYCAPTIFFALWKLVYPFIDPVTREKVKFVYEKDAERDFKQGFDLDVLPKEILSCGTGRWVTLEQRYSQLLADVAAEAQQAQHAPAPASDEAGEVGGAGARVVAGPPPMEGKAEGGAQLRPEPAAVEVMA
ncbi:hypothetical protein HYH03_005424 [Edaphochlamys debaryana]|uniref:CRAL-TRIO domain-containing protein n=1 Tax=Edaphochlamys debaryana TaxID=47281 RepID=A0A836C2A0_9CHLO|nr:hypothetical protein HYH03_005424 [Edaphochlamys debaryana]|eukprot:KAG2496602.1 hypothetical protein HYH03_005424 [Edaphochlamys debaryana]